MPATSTFFSYNSKDIAAVRQIVERMTARGMAILWDYTDLRAGQLWLRTMQDLILNRSQAVAVFVGPHGIGRWQYYEMALAIDRSTREEGFPVIPVLLPGSDPGLSMLTLHTWIDLRTEDPAAAYDLFAAACNCAELPPEQRSRAEATRDAISPFRGLLPFREEDAGFFFGRGAFTATLLDLFQRQQLVAVIGPSGSGKSSVVNAALLPKLRKEGWQIATLMPGDQPWRSLATSLVAVVEPKLEGLEFIRQINATATDLADKKMTVRELVEEVVRLGAGCPGFVLVVDQWEEIYTLNSNPQLQSQFLHGLLDALKVPACRIVITFRADFYAHALADRRLADLLNLGALNLGPMTEAELRESIEEPARKLGTTFDPALVEKILADVLTEPGSLPLLEFVLTELWSKRRERPPDADAYKKIGGIRGAIAKVAETTWAKLSEEEQKSAMRVLLRLVQPRPSAQPTRRRASMTEFSELDRRVIPKLVNSRVLVTSHDAATGGEILDVAHEALVDRWERLAEWVRTDREFLLWRLRLQRAYANWHDSGEDESSLLRGPALEEGRKWFLLRPDYLSDLERRFVSASLEQDKVKQDTIKLNLDTVRELSDSEVFASTVARSDTLWPAYPEKLEELAKLRDDLSQLLASLPRKQELRDKIAQRRDLRTSPLLRWQESSLETLITDLSTAQNDRLGLLASIDARLEFARQVRTRTLDQQHGNWTRTLEQLRRNPRYRELTLRPQMGLIPLGEDPASGLLEFLHFQTHEGPLPSRDAQGRLSWNEQSGIILVLLPAGEFLMGAQSRDPGQPNYDTRADDDEGPVHSVSLGPFFISKYLMTQGQWLRFTGSNPSRYAPEPGNDISLNHPVEEVSLIESERVLGRLGLTVPTEAQWEYAARAGGHDPALAGDELRRYAHLDGNDLRGDSHAPVGAYLPNSFGLYDMVGNCWEWTRDFVRPYTDLVQPDDGLRGPTGRYVILRGGCYFNSPTQARLSWRTSDLTADKKHAWLGVRPARALSTT